MGKGCQGRGGSAMRRSKARLWPVFLTASMVALSHGAVQAAPPGATHPGLWPRAHSPAALTDRKTEARVRALMARMSLEEKVGQVIQADISSIRPEDLRTYPLGS